MSSKQSELKKLRRVAIINGKINVTIDSNNIDDDTLLKLISIEYENEELRKENSRLQSLLESTNLKEDDRMANSTCIFRK